MGGCFSVSLSCDQVLNQVTQWLCVKVSYIHNLKENLSTLETTMEDLKGRRNDMVRKVEREENKGLRRLDQIQVWLTEVEKIESQVHGLLSARTTEIQRLRLCGFCSNNLKLSYRYGKRVFMMLKEVENHKSKGEVFDVVAEQAQASEVVERPIQPIIVGQETMLEMAWNHILDDEVSLLGLCGMGGVGKTTLLKQINNRFLQKEVAFDVVIWVVVSKDLQIQTIQEEIAMKLGLASGVWNQDQKACDILRVLRKKKFVLMLDDIWAKVDLTNIGVPKQKGSKVIFTTRSQEVCRQMEVDVEMEVQCLAPDDALDLFRKKVGETTLRRHPNIPELAKEVAKRCQGLPLALNVIGSVMSPKRTIQEWHHALYVLTENAAEFPEVEDKILPILKYSYHNLKDERVKSCFLYCTLFPEDRIIYKHELIEYWICEGIIDGSKDTGRAENIGYEIIGSLVRSSWLMEIEHNTYGYLNMHDVVREMGLWIASNCGKGEDHFVVRAGAGLSEIPNVKNWNVVRRMSLHSNNIDGIVGSLECPELTTLFLQWNKIVNISGELFRSMLKLVVLDLSFNSFLCELPEEISELVSLKYLQVRGGDELEDIINKEKAFVSEGSGLVPFLKLELMLLDDLPELKNIYWRPLPFPCLRELIEIRCPKLRKLPLDSKSGVGDEKGLVIKYSENEWIEGVEWEDEATKARFLPTSTKY